jgi:hypothetical protein
VTATASLSHISSAKLWLSAFFILCALPLGFSVALITPPGQSPDEPAQLVRAAGLLHGAIMAVRKPVTDSNTGKLEMLSGVQADTGLFMAAASPIMTFEGHRVYTAADAQAWRAAPTNHALTFYNVPNTGPCFPAVFLPASIGLGLGELFRLPPSLCFLLGRFAMLGAYLLLGTAAILVASFGEALLLSVLLMPMTVFLGGTLHQDGVLIAATCLACAALTRGSPRSRVLGLIVFALVLGSKPPYMLLLGAFMLPLAGGALSVRCRQVGLALLPIVVWIVLTLLFVSVPFDHPPYHPGPLFAGDRSILFDHSDPGLNLHILLSHPSRFITLPLATLQQSGVQALREMIGVLGGLQIVLPDRYYELWGVALAAALYGLWLCPRAPGALPGRARVEGAWVLALLFVTIWGIFIAQYLSWSDIGAATIQGIEGRYFLILIPFLLFVIPRRRADLLLPAWVPAIPAVALGIFDIGYIPLKLVYSFYLH